MKKILSLILTVILCASAFSVTAEGTYTAETFEDETLDGVFLNNNVNTKISTLPDGTKAMTIIGSEQLSHIYIDTTNMASDDKYIISFDAMLSKLPTTGVGDSEKTIFTLGACPHNGTSGITVKYKPDGTVVFMDGATEKGNFEVGKWYKVVVLKDGNGNGNGYTYITDPEGNTINRRYWMAPGTPFKLAPIIVPYGVSTDAELIVDNLVFGSTKASDSPALAHSTAEDGKTGVLRNDKICFTFNQELDAASTVTVEDSLGTPVTPTVKVGVNSVEITFGTLLKRGEAYTVSFENVKNKAQVACADSAITFTTEETHVMSAPEISEAIGDGDKTKLKFTIKDPHNYPTFSGLIMAAAYDEENALLGFDMLVLTDAPCNTLTEKEFGINITNAKKVKLMLLDYEGGLSPLAIGEKTLGE